MKSGVTKTMPCWRCLECGLEEPIADTFVPQKCPGCGSKKIDSPPIKIDGDEEHPLKKY